MKRVVLVGFPDQYNLNITNNIQNSGCCNEFTKKYTNLQFFRDYKNESADIIFLDSFSKDSEITDVAKKIRAIDSEVFIVGMSMTFNPILKETFKKEITKSDFILKTQDNKNYITQLLEGETPGTFNENKKQKSKTALVVDDFSNTLNVIKFTLEKNNINVITAGSGEEALKILNKQIIPDIIITDLNMPKMDGFELIENIRKIKEIDKVPIFILTTDFNFNKKLKAKQLNVTGWIQKPYNSNDFIKIIGNALKN
jgi:two-component system chemotaxis response regulator CheY